MDYYKLFDFKIEPFSNSPDPRLFYHSKQHLEVLQKLEISVRLKRGLNVVFGDIGTGKTTVSRQLMQKISNDKAIEYYLILDPGFRHVRGFLTHILQLLVQGSLGRDLDESSLKERIKTHLFTRGIDENINTVLIIDEGQKLSLESLEVLRELLNFETNDQKLLQIVIFAQNEFDQSLDKVQNFQDRINFRYYLTALNFKESKGLIQYRLNQSFITGKQRPVFSWAAFIAIYAATKGSPRKMVNLCHQVILSLIIKNKKKAGVFLIRSCVKKSMPPKKTKPIPIITASIILACIILTGVYYSGYFARKSQDPTLELYPVFRETPATNFQFDIKPRVEERRIRLYPILENLEKNLSHTSAATPAEPGASVGTSSISPLDQVPPDVYGSILVPANTTMVHMINLVYGTYSSELLNQVMTYNKNILDPDRLLSGIPLHFPVPTKKKEYPDHTVFLLILQTRDFNQAFAKAASVNKDIDVRILPLWYQGKEWVFNVIIDRPFENQDKAIAFLKNSEPGIAAVPKSVLSLKLDNLIHKG